MTMSFGGSATPRLWPVLVPEAHAVGAIGVIRSLGRAGYRVHAIATRSDALGLRSRYASRSAVAPPYESGEFPGWLREYVVRYEIRAVVPSDGVLIAVWGELDAFLPLFPVVQDRGVILRAFSKYLTLECFLSTGAEAALHEHLPPTMLFAGDSCVAANEDVRRFDPPYFVKGDALHARGAPASECIRIADRPGLEDAIRSFGKRFDHFVVQGHAPGRDAGVYFVVWKGRVLAEFMNLALHSVPHTGGFYSLRTSWRHGAIREDALRRITALGWEGPAMVEYRWDPVTDQFAFVEVNARFWGSLNHALYAGVDFPRILLDAHAGHPPQLPPPYAEGLRCRYTFPAEIRHVASVLRDPALAWKAKVRTVTEFFLLFADWRVRSDLFFPGDRKLYWLSALRPLGGRG